MSETSFPSNQLNLLLASVLHTFLEIAYALSRDIFGPVRPMINERRLYPRDSPMNTYTACVCCSCQGRLWILPNHQSEKILVASVNMSNNTELEKTYLAECKAGSPPIWIEWRKLPMAPPSFSWVCQTSSFGSWLRSAVSLRFPLWTFPQNTLEGRSQTFSLCTKALPFFYIVARLESNQSTHRSCLRCHFLRMLQVGTFMAPS